LPHNLGEGFFKYSGRALLIGLGQSGTLHWKESQVIYLLLVASQAEEQVLRVFLPLNKA
jgi:hypothetical protein